MVRYRVCRVGLRSLARTGCWLGALLVLAPALLGGFLAHPLVAAARGVLEPWQELHLGLFNVDLVQALHLEGALAAVQALDAAGWWLALPVALAFCLGGGIPLALLFFGLGLGYNLLAPLSGGLEFDVQPAQEAKGDGRSA